MSSVIRLNTDHREFLFNLAKGTIKCPTQDAADVAAYKRAYPLIRALVEERFPARDMRVLAKYGTAERRGKPKLQLEAGGVVQFSFREDEHAPFAPAVYENRSAIYAAGPKETAAYEASSTAADAFKKAWGDKLNDYQALINASATLAEVEKVWPEAGALRARVGRALPVILSDEIIKRIQDDASYRKAA